MTIKYKQVDLGKDEYYNAVFERDSLKTKLEISEFNLKSFKKEIELRIPHRALERNLKDNLKKMEEEIKNMKDNLKVFDKQVRTKKREVPFSYEKDDKSEEHAEKVSDKKSK